MIPYNNTDLPVTIKYDLEMMKLLNTAKELYGKLNAIIAYQEIDPFLILKPFILQESYMSSVMSGNKISQSSLYYMKYYEINDDILEIYNYSDILQNIEKYLSKNDKITYAYINKIHKDLLRSKRGYMRNPGHTRSKVSWIGRRGSTIDSAEYVPVAPRDINESMANYIKHFNKRHSIDHLIDVAISHAQFVNIHPYDDGNGRVGRILLSVHGFLDHNDHLSILLSSMIKSDEYSYYNRLKDTRNGKWERYIKFYLELLIKQLNEHIQKIDDIRTVYYKDIISFENIIGKKNYKLVFNYLFSNITSTIKEASNDLGIDYQTIRNYFNKLFAKGILAKHKINNGEYVYTYIKMYNIHVPIEWI